MVIDFNITPNNIIKEKNNENDTDKTMNDVDSMGTYIFDDNGAIIAKLSIPLELPLSAISQLNNGLYIQMLAIFNKYIRVSSTHQLNLSGDLRDSLTKFFADQDLRTYYTQKEGQGKDYKLFNLLDGCCMEILKLMFDSFGRFVATKAYHEVYNDKIGMCSVQITIEIFDVHVNIINIIIYIENESVLASECKELFNEKLPVIERQLLCKVNGST